MFSDAAEAEFAKTATIKLKFSPKEIEKLRKMYAYHCSTFFSHTVASIISTCSKLLKEETLVNLLNLSSPKSSDDQKLMKVRYFYPQFCVESIRQL
jgi:hypothetical protein